MNALIKACLTLSLLHYMLSTLYTGIDKVHKFLGKMDHMQLFMRDAQIWESLWEMLGLMFTLYLCGITLFRWVQAYVRSWF